MSRVRLCREHPGLVVRHHDFENFPDGTTPHTTAPFDYLIVGTSLGLAAFSSEALDLAGALVSPLLALGGGCFLWWWTRRCRFRHRWPALLLYAISPILVHATELGRPDHQSLISILVLVALGAEWLLVVAPSALIGVVVGAAWAFALWVSFYEPLVIFVSLQILGLVFRGRNHFRDPWSARKPEWLAFGAIIFLSLIVEKRIPVGLNPADAVVRNWAAGI